MKTATPHTQNKRKTSWALWIIILLIITGICSIVVMLYKDFSSISDKEYADIEKSMQRVYADMNLSGFETKKLCHDYKDSMSNVLKCQVEMVAYVKLSSPDDIQKLSTDFEQNLRPLSPNGFTLQKSPLTPNALIWSGSFMPKDSKLPMGCTAEAVGQGEKISMSRAFREWASTDKAAVFLGCGGKSQEAYFTKY